MAAYALSIFTGAFLLFQVQPLIGKYVLPWFGGTPAVWTTCLLFFQVLLLGGYAYAHALTRWLKPRTQAAVHGAVLLAALAALPIIPANHWKPPPGSDPVWRILVLLAASVGLPYFVLSSTGPLMQAWLSRTHPGRSPYRLYALSNAASLVALVSYPFLVETHFTRKVQAMAWSAGLILFALASGYCAWRFSVTCITTESDGDPNDASGADPPAPEPPKPTPGQKVLWVLLPACATVLLLATTNKLCQDVAVVPFLWVLPLALYLLAFAVCFDHPRWYLRPLFSFLLAVSFAAICWALYQGVDLAFPRAVARVLDKYSWLRGLNLRLGHEIAIYCAALFVGCVVCLGELYRLRPHPRYLTSYYLLLATGGALGGVFVALLAPLLFNTYIEFNLGVWACAALLLWVCVRDRSFGLAAGLGLGGLCVTIASAFIHRSELRDKVMLGDHYFGQKWWWWCAAGLLFMLAFTPTSLRGARRWTWRAWGYGLVAVVGLGLVLYDQASRKPGGAILFARNFYGVLTVLEHNEDDPERHYFTLQNGRITHGIQATDPKLSFTPVSYYTETSGVGLALRNFPRQSNRRIGVVGLGTGTMAAYGRKGDVVRFYDINPRVRHLAQSRFTYLKQCPAKVEIVMGDARLSMEAEPPENYDVLVLDAFSSDAIPVHLLTKEAGEIYLRHLKPDGVLAVHISNRYLDLEPVVLNLAAALKLKSAVISDDSEPEWWSYTTTWVLLTRNAELLALPPIRDVTSAEEDAAKAPKHPALWTDDYASLFPILK